MSNRVKGRTATQWYLVKLSVRLKKAPADYAAGVDLFQKLQGRLTGHSEVRPPMSYEVMIEYSEQENMVDGLATMLMENVIADLLLKFEINSVEKCNQYLPADYSIAPYNHKDLILLPLSSPLHPANYLHEAVYRAIRGLPLAQQVRPHALDLSPEGRKVRAVLENLLGADFGQLVASLPPTEVVRHYLLANNCHIDPDVIMWLVNSLNNSKER